MTRPRATFGPGGGARREAARRRARARCPAISGPAGDVHESSRGRGV